MYAIETHLSTTGSIGDVWNFVTYLLQQKQSYYYNDRRREDIDLIKSLLIGGEKLVYSEDLPRLWISHETFFACETVATTKQWLPTKNQICYQFDGKYDAELKNLTPFEEKCLLDQLNHYQLQNVGNRMPLPQIVDHLAASIAFVGVPSGISFVALSVGLPTFIILNRVNHENYKNREYYQKKPIFCNNYQDFLKRFSASDDK